MGCAPPYLEPSVLFVIIVSIWLELTLNSIIRIACLCAAINLALGALVLAAEYSTGAALPQHSAKSEARNSSHQP